jgi:hypothetical protein
LKAHGTPGMQALGADSYLGAQSELPPVSEAGAGIDVHRCRVDLIHKAHSPAIILGDDSIRMLSAVLIDVIQSFVQAVHHFDRQHQRQKLGVKVALTRRAHRGVTQQNTQCARFAAQLNPGAGQVVSDLRQEGVGYVLVDKQGVQRGAALLSCG